VKILLLGDMHVGSIYAVMPPKVVSKDDLTGGEMKFSYLLDVQKKLWNLWSELCEEKYDCVLVNGDCCDGPQKRSIGKFTWTNDLGLQAQTCADMLKGIKSKKFYFTLGSEYHSQEDRPLDKLVSDLVGGQYGADLLLDLKEEDVRIHAQHYIGVSTSTWQYRTTSLARDMVLLLLNSGVNEYGKVDYAVRSHAHFFVAVEYSGQGGVVLPGWQIRTPFGVKRGMITPPNVGYCVLDVKDGTIHLTKHLMKVREQINRVTVGK